VLQRLLAELLMLPRVAGRVVCPTILAGVVAGVAGVAGQAA
jgi:hypothetical protein